MASRVSELAMFGTLLPAWAWAVMSVAGVETDVLDVNLSRFP